MRYTEGIRNGYPVVLRDGSPLENDSFIFELNRLAEIVEERDGDIAKLIASLGSIHYALTRAESKGEMELPQVLSALGECEYVVPYLKSVRNLITEEQP